MLERARAAHLESAAPQRDRQLTPCRQDDTLARAWGAPNLLGVGQVRSALGDDQRALAAFAEFLTLSSQRGDRFLVPTALQAIARIMRRIDRLDTAARLLGAAQSLAASPHGPRRASQQRGSCWSEA
jgi:hypothetical protein